MDHLTRGCVPRAAFGDDWAPSVLVGRKASGGIVGGAEVLRPPAVWGGCGEVGAGTFPVRCSRWLQRPFDRDGRERRVLPPCTRTLKPGAPRHPDRPSGKHKSRNVGVCRRLSDLLTRARPPTNQGRLRALRPPSSESPCLRVRRLRAQGVGDAQGTRDLALVGEGAAHWGGARGWGAHGTRFRSAGDNGNKAVSFPSDVGRKHELRKW